MSVKLARKRRASSKFRRLFLTASNILLKTFPLYFAVVLLLVPNVALAGKTSDVCTLRTFWTSRLNKVIDNTYVLGEFRPTLDNEGETEKFYKHGETGLTVSVGVRYDDGFIDGFSGKPTEIKLAVAVADREQYALNLPDSALAGADYRKGKLNLYAEKRWVVGDLTYSFILDCRTVRK